MSVLDTLGAIASMFVLTWMLAASPQRAQCPVGWWLPEGVRTTGRFTCRPAPVGTDERNAAGFLIDHSIERHGFIEGQIYCRPSDRAVIGDDGRTIECRK